MTPKEYIKKDRFGTFYHRDPEMTVWHRECGLPSREWDNGDKGYLENDRRHRLDGVAYDRHFLQFHYLNGKELFIKL